jgi:hypothetical protein
VGISKPNLKFDVCIDGVAMEDSSPGVCEKADTADEKKVRVGQR